MNTFESRVGKRGLIGADQECEIGVALSRQSTSETCQVQALDQSSLLFCLAPDDIKTLRQSAASTYSPLAQRNQ